MVFCRRRFVLDKAARIRITEQIVQMFKFYRVPMNKTDKRQDIFRAALKLFARYGFKKTTVEDVAAEVGMTKSNLYFYVANKRELYEQTVGNALIQWRDSVAAAISQVDDVVENSP